MKSGDTCWDIATTKGIPESYLEDWNPLICGSGLKVGANLCVVGPAAAVGFNASTALSSATAGTSATASPVSSSIPAQVSDSLGHRVPTRSMEGLFALLMGAVLLL